MHDFYAQRIKETRKLILRWHGQSAMLRLLTTSHKTLEILVFTDGKSMNYENLQIACIGPCHINSPIDWPDNRIEVVKSRLNEANVAIIDKQSGVAIHAASFEVRENVKLK